MTIEYLKKADKSATTGEDDTRKIVSQMLSDIEAGGEEKATEYATKLDNYSGNIVVTTDETEAATAQLSQQLKDDVQFAYYRVRGFAEIQ